MIKSVVREHHWPPEIMDGLFLDGANHFGLCYWYNDVVEVSKQLKDKSPK